MKRFAFAVAAVALAVASSAHAVPVKMSTSLEGEILKARQVDPAPFIHVSAIVSQAPLAHEKARARHAPVAQQLARLGPAATLPMLEKLSTEQPALVRRDLIEAVGLLADARAVPVLTAVLADASEDAETTRTTAEALARIGTDEAAHHLVSTLSAASGDRARANVLGMGELRKLRVTEAIAARARTGDDAMVRAAARALGRAGNAWAWKTVADRSEEQKIRETAARALLDAFVAHEGETRDAASNALMVVDASITPGLIAQARAAASPSTQAALDALAARFAKNPSR
jgi:HEAT repeat protein